MKIKLKDDLPFIEVTLTHKGKTLSLKDVLVDTGSASTLISSDIALDLGLGPSPDDKLVRIHGVGGSEFVYEKDIDEIKLDTTTIKNLKVDVGAMNYGFKIDAILGMNFFVSARIIININEMIIYSASKYGQ